MKQNQSKKSAWIMIGLVLCMFGMNACQRKENPNKLTFMYWGDVEEVKILEQVAKEFQALHPEITIENQRASAGGTPYDDKLTIMMAAQASPDVFMVSSYYADKYLAFGALADLSQRAAASPQLGLKDFYPEMIEEFTYDKKLVAVPRDVAPVACLYYNKDYFKKMGVPFPTANLSWPDDFVSLAKKLTKRDAKGNVEVYGYSDDWEMPDVFIYSAGGGEVDNPLNPTRVALDSPASMEGLQFRADLIHRYKVMQDPAAGSQAGTVQTGSELFKTGRLAMFYSGVWQSPSFRQIKNFDWDIALPPKHQGTGLRRVQGGGTGYAMSGRLTGVKADNAWALVEFMTSPQAQAKLAATGLIQPANKKVAEGPAFLDGQKPLNKKILLGAVADIYTRTHMVKWREVLASGPAQAMNEVYRGTAQAKDVMPAAVAKVNAKFFPKEAPKAP